MESLARFEILCVNTNQFFVPIYTYTMDDFAVSNFLPASYHCLHNLQSTSPTNLPSHNKSHSNNFKHHWSLLCYQKLSDSIIIYPASRNTKGPNKARKNFSKRRSIIPNHQPPTKHSRI